MILWEGLSLVQKVIIFAVILLIIFVVIGVLFSMFSKESIPSMFDIIKGRLL